MFQKCTESLQVLLYSTVENMVALREQCMVSWFTCVYNAVTQEY